MPIEELTEFMMDHQIIDKASICLKLNIEGLYLAAGKPTTPELYV
jgi:hypothetical protein